MKKKLISISLLAIGFIVGMSAISTIAAGTWTAPTATAPGGNVDAPVNVGATAQIKEGTLTLGGLGVVGNFTYLPAVGSTVTPGQVLVAQNSSGKVGWGDAAGGSSGNGSRVFSVCNNNGTAVAGSATACTQAQTNSGAGTSRYRAMSCLAPYTSAKMNGSMFYSGGKWSTQMWSTNIDCTDGTILVADLEGGGGTASTRSCVVVDSGPTMSTQGDFPINLLINGKNICSDDDGCTISAWSYTSAYPAGESYFGSAVMTVRQASNGQWIFGHSDEKGTQGDGVSQALVDSWGPVRIVDDTTTYNTANEFVLTDSKAGSAAHVIMCD